MRRRPLAMAGRGRLLRRRRRLDMGRLGYRRIYESLSRWSGTDVDPHQTKPAQHVFTRLKAAIDARTYSREGERSSLGSGHRFADFVTEWKTHYKEEYNLTSNSLDSMLNVLTAQFGTCTLEYLSSASTEIERWLNSAAKERHWTDNTWLRYYELLNALFGRARRWTANNAPRMRVNPMEAIMRRVGSKRRFSTRLEEEIEDKLLQACAQLNRPQHRPNTRLLTWEKVEQIRGAVAAGESQKSVAARFGISSGLCSQIIKGDIWNPDRYTIGTKGDEMRLRVLAAFRTGLRRGEMLDVQLKHVQFRPVMITVDGQEYKVLTIELPPKITKGGKSTGEIEYVYAADQELKDALTARRFELSSNPDAYVFGTKAGKKVNGFRRMWHELFTLAGLEFGRANGIVWHTIRHEFVSRALEQADGDPVVAQEMARHKDLRTTTGYLHARRHRVLTTAVRLRRR